MKKLLMLALAAALLAPVAGWGKDVVKVGVLSDLSGPTSDVGRPYADGVKAAGAWLNTQGGVAGRELELIQVDYAYNVQQALAAYKNMLSKGIVALQGWGTGDTEALVQFVARDRIPTFSASYSAHLTDPAKAPYNFFVAADYSTMLRAGLKYFKDHWKGQAAPRLALIYPNHPYGLSPIAAGKAYAKELGFALVAEENVDLKAMDATTQLLAVQKAAPDFCWIGGTTASTAGILKDARKLGMKTQFFCNIWGMDENLVRLAGQAAEGAIGLQASAGYDDPGPGCELIRKLTKGEHQMTHFIRGFASMLVMAEAMRRAAAKGPLTGPNIKAAVETLRDYDPMGLTPPLTYLPGDHRPNMAAVLFTVQGGKLVKLGTSTLERRAEWLGK